MRLRAAPPPPGPDGVADATAPGGGRPPTPGSAFSLPFGPAATAAEVQRAVPEFFQFKQQPPVLVPAPQLFRTGEGVEEDKDLAGRVRLIATQHAVTAATPALALNWAVYRYVLLIAGHGDLVRKYRLDEVMRAENWKEYLGWLSDKAKKLGDGFDTRWELLVDLATFGGYALGLSDALGSLRDWIQDVKTHTVDGSEERFYEMFTEECDAWLDENLGNVTEFGSLEEYCEDPTVWARSGSSFDTLGKRLFVRVGTKELKAGKNKWASALAISPAETRMRVLSLSRQVGKLVEKRETKKVRGVISVDLDTYLKQDFVSWAWLDRAFAGNVTSTLWMTSEQTKEFWEAFMDKEGVACPLDQSEFDHRVTKRMVAIMISGLRKQWARVANRAPPEIGQVLDRVAYALAGGYVIIGGKRVPYRNGVLSGWKWTAFLDTMANHIEGRMARRLVKRELGYDGVLKFVAQGDDDMVRATDMRTAVALVLAYQHMSFKINASKFFISTARDEFLRKVSRLGKRELFGYAARSVNALTNRNPITAPDRPGSDRLNDILSRWNTLCARVGLTSVPELAYTDMMQGNRLSRELVEMWLHTPTQLGGGGIEPKVGSGLAATASSRTLDRIQLRAPGFDAILRNAAKEGIVADSTSVQRWLTSVLKFNPSQLRRVSQWTDAEMVPVNFAYMRIQLSAPIELPRQPVTWARSYALFPTAENARSAPYAPPPGVPRWWWVDMTTAPGGHCNFRIFGRSWDWLAHYSRPFDRRLERWFMNRRSQDRGLWQLASASVSLDVSQSSVWRAYTVRV